MAGQKSPLMGPCAMLVVPSYPYRPNVGFEDCFSCCHRSLHFASDAQRSCRVSSRLKFWLLNTTSSLPIQPPQVSCFLFEFPVLTDLDHGFPVMQGRSQAKRIQPIQLKQRILDV